MDGGTNTSAIGWRPQMDIALPLTVDAPLLLHGDCLDMLRLLPSASVDVVITDPPAGIGMMGKVWDSFAGYVPVTERGREVAARYGADALLAEAQALLFGLSLSSRTEGLPARDDCERVAEALRKRVKSPLGKLPSWAVGFVAFMVDVWTEVDRVLKPGGFVCAWALPKTADLAGLAMRSVGWDVHDSLLHLFGQGNAKAGDIGKKIDAMLGAEREVVGTAADFAADGHARRTDGTHATPGMDSRFGDRWSAPVSLASTSEAKRYTDWSSQLAPGHEQWLIAHKPTPLTYAQRVLTHGCGAYNIGACRVQRGDGEAGTRCTNRDADGLCRGHKNAGRSTSGETIHGPDTHPTGSWPKNVVLSEGGDGCPSTELDRQSGLQRDGVAVKRNLPDGGGKVGITAISPGTQRGADVTFAGSGGASRFFTRFKYAAKNSDRSAGLRTDMINDHATPKSQPLMRWLVALLAAKAEHTGGLPAVVLDCFMGSGSTGVACAHEQVRFIGIERDPVPDAPANAVQSFHIARARIMAAIGSPEAAAEANAIAPPKAQLSLL
jgi:hypothetical protein